MRALAVEDDPRIATDLEAALSAAGFRVELTGDGEDACVQSPEAEDLPH